MGHRHYPPTSLPPPTPPPPPTTTTTESTPPRKRLPTITRLHGTHSTRKGPRNHHTGKAWRYGSGRGYGSTGRELPSGTPHPSWTPHKRGYKLHLKTHMQSKTKTR